MQKAMLYYRVYIKRHLENKAAAIYSSMAAIHTACSYLLKPNKAATMTLAVATDQQNRFYERNLVMTADACSKNGYQIAATRGAPVGFNGEKAANSEYFATRSVTAPM